MALTTTLAPAAPTDGYGRPITRPDRKALAKSRQNGTEEQPYDPRLKSLAVDWDCTPEDFALIGESGLRGHPSLAVAVRVGRAACKLAEGSAWTACDCCVILADAKWKYDKIAKALGITPDRAEKLTRLGRGYPSIERHPLLTLSHHEATCALLAGKREEILAKAEAESLSVVKVQELVREAKPEAARNATGRPARKREPKLPVGPSPDAPATTPVTVPSTPAQSSVGGTGTYTPDPNPAPAGKSTVSPKFMQPGAMAILTDIELSDILAEKCGRDRDAHRCRRRWVRYGLSLRFGPTVCFQCQ